MNRDGKLDLVVADWSSSVVDILLGDGTGALGAPASYSSIFRPYSVAVADLNGDGLLDAAASSNSVPQVSVLRGDGGGHLGSRVDLTVGNVPVAVGLADLDRNGSPDVITSNSTDNTVSVLLGVGGSISSPGFSAMLDGEQLNYAISATPGYTIGNVYVDGVAQGALASYSFQHASGSHTISAHLVQTTAVAGSTSHLALALEDIRPNPSGGRDLTVTFVLPNASRASIELIDVGGRRIVSREVGSLGAGSHTVQLGRDGIHSGMYWVRLTQQGQQRTERAVILQ